MHTGTTWIRGELEANGCTVDWEHCDPDRVKKAKKYVGERPSHKGGSGIQLATTWRDPYRTAASWGNRRHLRHEGHWELQWAAYGEFLKLQPMIFDFEKGGDQHGFHLSLEPVNAHEDRFGLHEALDTGDWEKYWSIIPKETVQHALDCIPEEMKAGLPSP